MLPYEELRQVQTIVTHAQCADGTASAIILHDGLRKAKVRFFAYGPELDALEATPGMLFCDITPPRARAQEFVNVGAIVLDHHKGQEDVVRMFGERGVFADEKLNPGVSGAMLAFQAVWKPLRERGTLWVPLDPDGCRNDTDTAEQAAAEDFAKLVGIRDTWQRKSSKWEAACDLAEVLRFMPVEHWFTQNFPFREATTPLSWWSQQQLIGHTIRTKHLKDVKRAVEGGYRITLHGTRVTIFQGGQFSSDAADELGDTTDLVIAFDYEVRATVELTYHLKLSTRSRGTFDCKAFCQRYGGGGHTNAAGCTLTLGPTHRGPYVEVMKAIENFAFEEESAASVRFVSG